MENVSNPGSMLRKGKKEEEFLAALLLLCSYAEQFFGPGTRLTVLGKKAEATQVGEKVGQSATKIPGAETHNRMDI